jgi:heme/copper-type cytochrome/quinol oxidase subunit 4
MKSRRFSQYFITALFIFLILAALLVGAIYTFAVGNYPSTPTPTANLNPASTLTVEPEPTAQFPDQARISDGIIVMGTIIVAIILFGIIWGRRMTIHR